MVDPFKSFPACVFGASGGIGAALTARLAARADVSFVYAGARLPVTAGEKIRAFAFDLEEEASLANATTIMADEPPRLIIVATGMLHGGGVQPEKSLKAQTGDAYARLFATNATGPALIAKHMLARPPRERRFVFAALSARVGSISDNRLGGWHAYRASKAALNMIVRNIAIELGRTNPQAIAVTLHPGTVDTNLSKPFRRNATRSGLFSADYAAKRLLEVVDGLTPEQSGQCLAWDGSVIPS
jgi:NAD(P)-dependent dehydrogenase (short-subunit alcohol dehydrogenase family)